MITLSLLSSLSPVSQGKSGETGETAMETTQTGPCVHCLYLQTIVYPVSLVSHAFRVFCFYPRAPSSFWSLLEIKCVLNSRNRASINYFYCRVFLVEKCANNKMFSAECGSFFVTEPISIFTVRPTNLNTTLQM